MEAALAAERALIPGLVEDARNEEQVLIPRLLAAAREAERALIPGHVETAREAERGLIPDLVAAALQSERALVPGFIDAARKDERALVQDLVEATQLKTQKHVSQLEARLAEAEAAQVANNEELISALAGRKKDLAVLLQVMDQTATLRRLILSGEDVAEV